MPDFYVEDGALLLLLLPVGLFVLLAGSPPNLSAFTVRAARRRRSCSFSRFNPSMSTFFGAPMYRLMYSTALTGLSGSSYKPTRTFVRVSKTPVFSRYFRNSSFLDNSDEPPPLLLLLLLLPPPLWFDEEYDEEWLPELLLPLLL